MAKTWIVNDYTRGQVVRFKYPAISPIVALKAYIHHIAPWLSKEELEEDDTLVNFDGEIWAADDIKDIALQGG